MRELLLLLNTRGSVTQAAERGFIRIRNINSNDEAVTGIAMQELL